jgi:adenylylsulfate kinase-like enzyme
MFFILCCYKRAGIDDPYEEPSAAEVVLEARAADGQMAQPELMAQTLLDFLDEKGFLQGPPPPAAKK